MIEVSEDELKKRIERNFRRLERDKTIWDQIIPDKIPIAYYDMGLLSRGIAIYSLLLGKEEDALKWFEKAAEYYLIRIEKGKELKSVYQGNEPGVFLDALYMSVLSGNINLSAKIASGMLAMNSDFPEKFPDAAKSYCYVKSLAGLILNKPEVVVNSLKALVEANEKEKSEFFEGASKFIDGMITRNAELVNKGIEKVIKAHEKIFKKDPLTDDELVSISGTVMYLMAKKKNLEPAVKSKYIPDALSNLY